MEQSIFDVQAEFCKAMGHPARLQVLYILRDGPMNVGELAQKIGSSQSLVSRQLQVLRSVGAVSSQRHGTDVVYQLADTRIGDVCDLVRKVLSGHSHRHAKIVNE